MGSTSALAEDCHQPEGLAEAGSGDASGAK